MRVPVIIAVGVSTLPRVVCTPAALHPTEMSRVIAAVFVIGLALSHAAVAQVGPPPKTTGSSGGPLTKTVLAIGDRKTERNNPTGGETFNLDPVLTLSLDAPPAAAAAFDTHTAYVP